MKLLLLVAAVLVLASILFLVVQALAGRFGRWKAVNYTRGDGTLVVAVRRGRDERVVRELPPGLEDTDFQVDAGMALEEARSQAALLNRRS